MFSGTIDSMSHEGGLLLSFGGSSPALDSIIIRASDGVYIGKIDGVLGSSESPMAHVGHIDRKLDLNSLVGEEVTIRAKKPREERYPSSRDRGSRDGSRGNFDRGSRDRRDGGRRDGGRGNFDRGSRDRRDGGRGNFDRGSRGRNDSNDGDWDCPKCNNSNFARRTECNRCGEPRGAGGGGRGNFERGSRDRRDGGRGNFDRGSRDRRDGGRRDGGRGNFDRGSRDRREGGRREFSNRDENRTKPKENNFRKSKGKRAGHAHNNAPKPIVPRKFSRNSDD